MYEGPLDAFAQTGDGALKPTDVRESNRWRGDRVRAQRGRADGGERRDEIRCGQLRSFGGLLEG
jgi:hypothetical protein